MKIPPHHAADKRGVLMKRYVSTSFWDDEWVQSLDFTEKGLYLYLMTNSLTNIAGVYKLTNRRIVFDTGLDESKVEKIMQKFERAGKAYRHGEYVVLPSWPHHQKCANANIQRGIYRILKTLDSDLIAFLSEVGYRYPLEDFMQGKESSAETLPAGSLPQTETSEEMKLFLSLWQSTKDKDGNCIFQITAAIEKPRDWARFWRESSPTSEQIKTAFKNFADGINSGAIQHRFIPATPDRFVLRGGITRYQEPVSKESSSPEKSGGNKLAGKIEL